MTVAASVVGQRLSGMEMVTSHARSTALHGMYGQS